MSLAIENTKPGVTAVVNAGQVSRPLERQPTSTVFAIGYASWGPVGVRQTITSWADFVRVFGPPHEITYLADLAYIFFNHFGGKQLIAVRAAFNGEPAYATRNNRVLVTPTPTYNFTAKYPSNSVDITIQVVDVTDTNKVTLIITSKALNASETFENIDFRIASDLADFNRDSKLVSVNLLSAPVAGATGRPAVGTFSLTGGTDGFESDDPADLGSLLTEFNDETLGTGQVVIPGFCNDNASPLAGHAEAYNRLALVEFSLGSPYVDAIPSMLLGNLASSHTAVYYPWVEMKNLFGSGTKFYPPSIFAAGACAQVDRTIGTHKAPANITIPTALDVERNSDGTSVINDSVREFLNRNQVNVIAPLRGEGIKIYGARVLAPAGETRVRFVHERRMLNLIYYTAKVGYSWAVFQVVDPAGRLFRDLRSAGQTFLRNLWRGGALHGKTEAEAFVVVADESNNPPEELEAGRVHVQLGVKLSPTAETIFINIDNVPLSQDLNVLNGGNQ